MFGNLLKIAFRNFKKHGGYSFINIFGLGVSIACCLLIYLWVSDELSYDRFYEHSERIYRVGYYSLVQGNSTHGVQACPTLAPKLNSDFPEVEAATRFRKLGYPVMRYRDYIFSEENFFAADPFFFDVFNLPFIQGDPETALEKPNSLVINQSTARKYFGDDNPVGKVLNSDGKRDWRVTGVVKDIPGNSHFHFNFIASMNSYRGMGEEPTWLSNNYYTYFRLREHVDWKRFEQKLQREEIRYIKPQIAEMFGVSYEKLRQAGNEYYHFLQPLNWIHLHSNLEHELEPGGDMMYVTFFIIAALGILILAVANFVNLSTARSLNRAREVGIRKSVGSTRAALIGQFLLESILVVFFSMLFALLTVITILPVFCEFTGKNLVLHIAEPSMLLLILGFTLMVGVFAGLYPAFFLSSFHPLGVLKMDAPSSKRSWLRSALVVFQFSIAISLLIGTFVIAKQIRYVQGRKLTMNRECILNIHKADDLGHDIRVFKQVVLKHPRIIAASNSDVILGGAVGDGIYQIPGRPEDEVRVIHHLFADADYIRVYGVQVERGSFFPDDFGSDERGLVLNESALKMFELQDPIGQVLIRDKERSVPIVGIARNFHYRSLHHPVAPLVINVLGREAWGGREISLRISTQEIQKTIAFLEKSWRKFAGNQVFEYEFYDDYYNNLYRAEYRIGSIFLAFSIFAVFIAGLGLLGLSAFMVEQRTKEIGIRKVLGASMSGITFSIVRDYLKWVALANIIAWPVAYIVMKNWLENFAYRINPGIYLFVLPGLTAMVIALLTVSYQSFNAARANPVDSLRYE